MKLTEIEAVDAPSAPTRGVRASIALGYSRANNPMFATPVGAVITAGDAVFVLNGKREWLMYSDSGELKRVKASMALQLHKIWKTEHAIAQGKK